MARKSRILCGQQNPFATAAMLLVGSSIEFSVGLKEREITVNFTLIAQWQNVLLDLGNSEPQFRIPAASPRKVPHLHVIVPA